MISRRERLMATLRGEPVDRPAVNFYELGGFAIDPDDPGELNVYNDPSWRPLLQLAEERSDLIRMRSPARVRSWDPQAVPGLEDLVQVQEYIEDGWHCTRRTIQAGARVLSCATRRSGDMDTVWTTEHLLKSIEDVEAYLQLPDEMPAETVDVSDLVAEDEKLADRGIVMVDTEDPICAVASLFDMGTFLTIALTEPMLCHRLLERFARPLYARTEEVSRAFGGHLWRIYGPEYAAEPFLPPRLFREYVVRYTGPMVKIIRAHGGFARVHCHGRIGAILDQICEMGADATDPVEPPPQGDVRLEDVRRRYGDRLVLFGNIELSDIETMDPPAFRRVVEQSLAEGTKGQGRGFVLMPSSAPNGRTITARTLKNYETMIDLAESWQP